MANIERWTLKGGYSRDGNWPDEPTSLMTLVEAGPTLSMGEKVEVVPAEQLRGAVEDRDALLGFVRAFAGWQTTADLNRLGREARLLIDTIDRARGR